MTNKITEFYMRINEVAKKLPDLPKQKKKNFFDILGVERKETINSKMLAYFFNPEEEHGFGTLFFDCLVGVLIDKTLNEELGSIYSGTFKIEIEVSTSAADEVKDARKRIDLLIKGGDWSIIIENKLFHHVANPLNIYVQHAEKIIVHKEEVKAENRTDVILSLHEVSKEDCTVNGSKFLNVTHQELINKVQQELVLTDVENDIDIFYLREYAKTINSHYKNKMNDSISDSIITTLVEQKESVKDIVEKRNESILYIDQKIKEVFEHKGYLHNKCWYFHHDYKNVRFFITPSTVILETNTIGVAYELWYDSLDAIGVENLKSIKGQLTKPEEGEFDDSDKNDNKKGMKRVVTYRDKHFLSSGDTVKSKLEVILDNHFFNDKGVVEIVKNYLPKSTKYSTEEID